MQNRKNKIILSALFLGISLSFNSSVAYEYGDDPSQSSTGQSSSVRTAGTIHTTLTDINSEDTSERRVNIPGLGFFSGKVILDSEKGKAKVPNLLYPYMQPKKYDSDISAGIFSYSKDINTKFGVGIIIPYRKIKVDDEYDTKMDTYTLVPFIRMSSTNAKNNFTHNFNFFLIAGFNKIKSRMFGGKNSVSFYEFGLGALYNPIYKIRDNLKWTFSMQLNFDRYHTNYALLDTANIYVDKFYKDLIDRRGKYTTIANIGTSFIYSPIDNLDITIGFLHVGKIKQSQIDKTGTANYYYIKANYRWNRFRVGLGFKQMDGSTGYEEYVYMASISYDFF